MNERVNKVMSDHAEHCSTINPIVHYRRVEKSYALFALCSLVTVGTKVEAGILVRQLTDAVHL